MDRKQLILEAKEMYPELFGEMQEEIQETIKELVQPIEGGDKAHTTHEKIVAELEQDLRQAQATETRLRGLLKRCWLFIDICGIDVEYTISKLDPTLLDELAAELENENE